MTSKIVYYNNEYAIVVYLHIGGKIHYGEQNGNG